MSIAPRILSQLYIYLQGGCVTYAGDIYVLHHMLYLSLQKELFGRTFPLEIGCDPNLGPSCAVSLVNDLKSKGKEILVAYEVQHNIGYGSDSWSSCIIRYIECLKLIFAVSVEQARMMDSKPSLDIWRSVGCAS